jgi:hypothetical protein
MRPAVLLVMLAACGRLGFDARNDGSGDGGLGDGAHQQPGDGAGGSGAGLIVQVSSAFVSTGPTNVALPNPTATGTLLVANIAVNSLSGVSPPAGWQVNANGSVSGACVAAIATDASGQAGRQTFAFTAPAGAPIALIVSEWRGIPLGNAFDTGGFGGGTAPATAMMMKTMFADSTAGDLAIATFCQDTTMPAFTAGAGWSELAQGTNTASSPSILGEYQANEPAQQVTATAMSSVSAKYAAAVVTFHTQ